MPEEELVARARDLGAPLELVQYVAREKKLPVVLFCAGGVSTPADAALMMQLGAEGIFVGSGIFKSKHPAQVRQSDRRRDDALQRSGRASSAAHRELAGAAAMPGIDLRGLPENATARDPRQLNVSRRNA